MHAPVRGPVGGVVRRRLMGLVAALVLALGLLVAGAGSASAHVLPTSSVQLVVGATSVQADVAIPVSDLAAATGLDLGDGTSTTGTAAAVAADADTITRYLEEHVRPTTDDGRAWTVAVGDLGVEGAGDARTTGLYDELEATLTLTPPAGADVRAFDLGYDAVVDQVATHVVVVTVRSDWSGGNLGEPYEVGTVRRDTVTGDVTALHVDLGSGSELRGFVSMVALGVQHIAQGTDHQLFLLTLLLPAPLVAAGRRWGGAVGGRTAVRRIARTTIAFTLGHSVTLALGALGLPVPTGLVETAIALSILVAAVHAVRPLFPGREALVAAAFGLVHGLAFSEALRALDLSGSRLVLSLLGFNLGIELMQLVVVALVLPPLVLLAGAGRYRLLRLGAAVLTGVAAVGWMLARLGWSNPVADAADSLGALSLPVVGALWVVAAVVRWRAARVGSSVPAGPVRRAGGLDAHERFGRARIGRHYTDEA